MTYNKIYIFFIQIPNNKSRRRNNLIQKISENLMEYSKFILCLCTFVLSKYHERLIFLFYKNLKIYHPGI